MMNPPVRFMKTRPKSKVLKDQTSQKSKKDSGRTWERERSQRSHTGTPRRATYGGRVGLWPASSLGHDATQSPWRQHGQPDWRARPTTQGGQGAAQGRAGQPEAVRCRPQPAACRLPPPAARRPPATVKPCGPASSMCRRDGMAWAGNSWLPRAVGTAASRAERFCGNPNCSIRTPCSQTGEFCCNVTM